MRFMLLVKATGYTEAGVDYSSEYSDAKLAYNRALAMSGVLLANEELQPSWAGMRIGYSSYGSEPKVQAGPFPANQQLIAEYALIDVRSEGEALSWALRMPIPEGRGGFEIELRRVEDRSDDSQDPRVLAMKEELQNQLSMLRGITKL
ncbi:YciI family protein [Paenibacillus harenae]|uniref:YCII-related domain-containing protein n=1 Tax=Paenibacillus harenae TaxID=306543 RepID=A0ABT9U2J7_PAEHA|nr:YciI family protein [Paenibacillus harenae]MDQ0113851.1 hypothetical protein [Paenibacillus harenae]